MAQMLHYQVTFGHAQKIVNMAFKYLYCCHGAEKYEDTVFSHCHMPLDRNTIADYRKYITKEDTIPVWSKLTLLPPDACMKRFRPMSANTLKNTDRRPCIRNLYGGGTERKRLPKRTEHLHNMEVSAVADGKTDLSLKQGRPPAFLWDVEGPCFAGGSVGRCESGVALTARICKQQEEV